MLEKEKITVNESTLSYRGANKNRCVKPANEKDLYTSAQYHSLKNSERWAEELQKRQERAQQSETVYVLPLNTANEAKLIYYIDQLPSVKPYISELIRKDMKNPSVTFTKSWRRDYNNNVGKKRMFSLKFRNSKDTDIIEHLENIASQHISKRAYIIALLEKDIVDTGFQFPKELAQYNKENKVIKSKLADEFYKQMYYYIDNEIKKGNTTVYNRDARKFISGRMIISPSTLSSYWKTFFVDSGALALQDGSKCNYVINVDKVNLPT